MYFAVHEQMCIQLEHTHLWTEPKSCPYATISQKDQTPASISELASPKLVQSVFSWKLDVTFDFEQHLILTLAFCNREIKKLRAQPKMILK